MKTTTETKPTKFTFTPAITKDEARKIFIEKIGKAKDDGGNSDSNLDAFLALTDVLVSNGRSFTFSDLVSQARSFDVETYDLFKLFERWTSELIRLSKLEKIHGCFDEPIYIFN